MENRILVVVDMQNDFTSGALGNPECAAVVPYVMERMERARKEKWRIICTKDMHEENYLETGEGRRLPIRHCIRGSRGSELIDEIEALKEKWEDYETVFLAENPIEKNAFGSMELSRILSKYQPAEIELIGICTDICVISNAMILRSDFPDIEVSVNASCCAGVTPESHSNALLAMEACQIRIVK